MSSGLDSPRFLEQVRSALVTYKGTVGSPLAISDISKIARIEPITLVSSNLSSSKELYNVLHGVLNIYSAFYMQAVGILSAQLADIRILKILDKVNPDRDIKTLLTSGYIASESFVSSTLSLKDCKYGFPIPGTAVAAEHIFNEDEDKHLSSSIQRIDTFEKLGSAVGKVVES